MKITLFSSNQPRHLHLAKVLSSIADEVYFVSEVNTVFPGMISDFFRKSEVMKSYFQQVMAAEQKVFGDIGFLPTNVNTLAMKLGDLAYIEKPQLSQALDSDVYIIFGASYIKGWLIDFLIENNALNIHMGLSPYYRGSSCNFWALYDNKPGMVGATIHMLSEGLDSGEMLFHCLPRLRDEDTPFDFTMRAVSAAHFGLMEKLKEQHIFSMSKVPQEKNLQVRYSRNNEFTDDVADEFMKRKLDLTSVSIQYPELLEPFYY